MCDTVLHHRHQCCGDGLCPPSPPLQDIHKELEEKISRFHGREDTILYASCFDANAGLFEALLTQDDALFSDELNHASIIDGVRLCKTSKNRYKHRGRLEVVAEGWEYSQPNRPLLFLGHSSSREQCRWPSG